MVGKYAQYAFLLMVDWLGQCPSAVLQAGESQHPAPLALGLTTAPWSGVLLAAGSPGNRGTVGSKSSHHYQEKQALLLPSSPFFGVKDGLGLVSAWWPCPSKMCHRKNCWSSPQKKGSWSHTAHRLGYFQMWCIPPINVFIWQAPGSMFECCSSLWVWDGWAVQNDFL